MIDFVISRQSPHSESEKSLSCKVEFNGKDKPCPGVDLR